MTGGLAYLLQEEAEQSMVRDAVNRESVRFAEIENQEQQWLRSILQRHVQRTGSPRAAEILSCSALPLLRMEPVAPPCSVEESWSSILSRIAAEEARNYEGDTPMSSERPVVH